MDLKKLLLSEATFGVNYSKKELSINEPIPLYLDGRLSGEIKRTDRDKPFKLTEKGNLKTIVKVFYNSLNQEETKTIVYFCKNKKLKVGEKFGGLRPEDKKIFNEFCGSAIANAVTKSVSIGGGGKVNDQKLNDYPCVTKLLINPLGGKITINKEDNGQSITWQQKLDDASGMITFFNDGRYERGGKIFSYYCDGNKIIWSKKQTSNPVSDVGGGGNSPTRQSQTPTLIKQIQKTIGVAETGKLTDTEIQTIYDKLNPSTPVNTETGNLKINPLNKMQVRSQTAPTQLAGVPPVAGTVNEEINRIKEMMGIVLNEQSIPTEPQPEKTPTEKLQELLNSKFNAGLVPDGKMGPKTAQAIINALGKSTVTTPTPSSTNQTSSGTPAETKPTDNTSVGTPKQEPPLITIGG